MACACAHYSDYICGQCASSELLQMTSSGVRYIVMANDKHVLNSSVNVRILCVATQVGNVEENVKFCVWFNV